MFRKNLIEEIKPLWIIAIHIVCLFIVFYFLSYFDFFRGVSSTKQWDAFWYERIAQNGYTFDANGESTCGFFPLFSYIWRFMPFGNKGIVFFNGIFFIAGILLLRKTFQFKDPFLLLCLSVPSMMFMYVPYTEALFFFSTSVFLYGLVKNNFKALYLGLFIASVTRPTALFFIPSILFMELMHYKDVKTVVFHTLKYSLPSILGVVLVTIIQYAQTGVWFAYFKAQSNSWNRELQWPKIPFTTWDGTRMLWLDGIALFFGLIACVFVIYFLIKKLSRNRHIDIDKATCFSLSYVALCALSVIFFNGKDTTGGTSLMGANRYVLSSCCFILFLKFLGDYLSTSRALIILFVITCGFGAYFLGLGSIIGSFDHGHSNRYVLFVCLYVLSYLFLTTKYNPTFNFIMYTINIFAQIFIFSTFCNGLWVG